MRFTALLPRRRRTIVGVAILSAAVVPLIGAPSGAVPVCNTAPITFTPPGVPTPAVLPFSPYPSNIVLSKLSGTVTDVNVTLNGITHVRPEDIDVLVVAPDGSTNLLVMSDIGGDNVFPGEAVSGVNLTFDDEAATAPPTDSILSSGTFRPVDDDDDADQFSATDAFVSPAPAASSATALSVFDGASPNGTWSLYVVDDQPGPPEPAGLNGGWCIDVTTSGPATTSTSSSTTSTSTSSSTSTSTTSTSTTSTSTTSTSTTSTSTVPGGDCAGLTPTITGTAGPDNITGTPGPDVIVGGSGDDTINGLGGGDTLCGQDGDDTIGGDSGNDTIRGGPGDDSLLGGGGDDDVSGGAGDDTINGNDGNDRVFGTEGSDTVTGGGGDDFVSGGDGNDFLTGGAGDDHVEGNAGDDRVLGASGNDDLEGNQGSDVLNAVQGDAGSFADTLNGGPQVDQCFSDPSDTPPSSAGGDC